MGSFQTYQAHALGHAGLVAGCPWCFPLPGIPMAGNPFGR